VNLSTTDGGGWWSRTGSEYYIRKSDGRGVEYFWIRYERWQQWTRNQTIHLDKIESARVSTVGFTPQHHVEF